MVDLKRILDKWETEYKNERRNETEEVYSRVADALQGASVETALAALELAKNAIVLEKLKATHPDLLK